jgi:formate dehydrogenase
MTTPQEQPQSAPIKIFKRDGAAPRKLRPYPKGSMVTPEARSVVQDLCSGIPFRPDLIIEHLHRIQDAEHGLRPSRLNALAEALKISPVEVFEVASFYHSFHLLREDEPAPQGVVKVCTNAVCAMHGAQALLDELQSLHAQTGVRVQESSCMGLCTQAPGVLVNHAPVGHATVESVQHALATTKIEPCPTSETYAQYVARGGYDFLRQCRAGLRKPQDIIDRVETSVLRGLGGSGFPSVKKWATLRAQPGPRLMLVNIDEGEVGTCKDGHILRTQPHEFLEGMLIVAWTLAVDRIWIYLRDEYAPERAMLLRELQSLDRDGLLRFGGVDIGGPNDDEPGSDEDVRRRVPRVALRRGAGAYICGEESALIESLEGHRGLPRIRPPRMTVSGLFGKPTLGHNVETLWWVRDIVDEQSAHIWNGTGEYGRPGVRRFTVSGRVAKPGVYLAPAGITVRALIDNYAGGMAPGWELYGAMPGGASGGILNAEQCEHVPLDFGTMDAYRCYLGSMAVMVMGTNQTHTDTARFMAENTMRFFADESCGQCTPCREGTRHMLAQMAEPVWDQQAIVELGQVMRDASICGLGQAAPNLTDGVIRHFPHEITDAVDQLSVEDKK